MSTYFEEHLGEDQVVAAEELRGLLAKRADRLLSAADETAPPRLVRLTARVPTNDLLGWLAAQPFAQKVYWSGRGEASAFAAAGIADLCTGSGGGLSTLERNLPLLQATSGAPIRYFGGLRFDLESPGDGAWQPFGTYWFLLPRFELHATPEGATRLACNLVLPRDQRAKNKVHRQIQSLALAGYNLSATLPSSSVRRNYPGHAAWIHNVDEALSRIRSTALQKVVLARQSTFSFDQQLPPALLLKKLQDDTAGCFHFLFQPAADTAFVGASPERLFRKEKSRLASEALAGTRPRAQTATADEKLRDELLASEKDQREHEHVRMFIAEALRPHATALEVDSDVSAMTLTRGRHLYSGVRGTLKEGVSAFDLLSALHPTPAVGGLPRKRALQVIRDLEAFDRGWYTGPVGWVGPQAAEFAVGIRSGLVHDNRLSLYSGAGIVTGSEPHSEWEEIEQKISNFAQVLHLHPENAAASL